MTNPTSKKSQRVRFEEATPTNEIVAYFNTQLPYLLAGTGLPIFPGYDDLDDIQFAYINLPSGNTVVLGQYENAPEIGVDLYIDFNPKNNLSTLAANIPALVVETLRYLAISRATAVWFHPDYETEIDRLNNSEPGEVEPIARNELASLPPNEEREPIDFFYYALNIYTREEVPEYWAMLQHNLGLAYFDRIKGKRWGNLQKSLECFNKSLEVFDRDKFPVKWQINQEDWERSSAEMLMEKTNIVDYILGKRDWKESLNLKYVNLNNTDLFGANLIGAKLCCANLSNTILRRSSLNGADMSDTILRHSNLIGANLTGANLMDADLMDADLMDANLTGVNLTGANLINATLIDATLTGIIQSDTTNVYNARFGHNEEISESMRQDLKARGAIFYDSPGDRAESRTPVSR